MTVLIDSRSAGGGGRKSQGQNGGAGLPGNLQSDLEPLFEGKWEESLWISEQSFLDVRSGVCCLWA